MKYFLIKITALCFLLTIIGLSFQNVFAQSVNDVIIITENYPPFNFKDGNKLQGISVDLMDKMLKEMGAKQTRNNIQLFPWARGYTSLQTDENICLFSTTRTEEREKKFKWVGPITNTTISLIAKKDKEINIKSSSDFKNYKIGVVIDDIGEQLLIKSGISKNSLDRAGGIDALENSIKKLKNGRVDLIAYEQNVAMWTINKINLNSANYKAVHVLKDGEVYYAFSQKTDDFIIKEFQKALESVKETNDFQSILDKYLK